MLSNLKVVLLQHKKFLVIFFFIVFLPSLILAILGIRAIQNERYKLQQQSLDQQRKFVGDLQAEILSILERNAMSLREVSTDRAFIEQDYPAIIELILRLTEGNSLLGQVVVWNSTDSIWLPGYQAAPRVARTLVFLLNGKNGNKK